MKHAAFPALPSQEEIDAAIREEITDSLVMDWLGLAFVVACVVGSYIIGGLLAVWVML